MDRRNQPVEFWGQSVAFWCRLWQVQFENSLRFWAMCTSRMPQHGASESATKTETANEIATPDSKRRTEPRRAAKTPAQPPAEPAIH